ncbi:MAG: segregation/condensation protein A [Halobacteriovoraceae bacterium]|nr:segregation/condensation protein A [Halobacteriovoraceae bacterium]
MLDTSIQVKTDHFDGPLGLLLLLIQKEEMDIRQLDLTTITQQYLRYLDDMKNLNFDIAGEYLYLAASLIHLKSKDCLTEDEDLILKNNEDGPDELKFATQAELIRRLEQLQRFQLLGEKLWNLPKRGHDVFTRPKVKRKEIVDSILTQTDINELLAAMLDFMAREKRKYTIVRRDRLSIKEKLQFLKKYLEEGKKFDFETVILADGERTIDNVVITFISFLELARLKKISIFQNTENGVIYVELVDNLENFDVESANGFEPEDETTEEQEELINQEVVTPIQ